MQIILENCGRRFNQDWIFRKLNYTFNQGEKYAILGPNGSGKSTLLATILGTLAPSEGTIRHMEGEDIPIEKIYQCTSLAAPYVDLVEEFTLMETIKFHFQFKQLVPGFSNKDVFDLLGLSTSKDKPLKYFSSGMKQRTKLVLSFCSATPILLLDEPTANLDAQGIDWYLQLVERFSQNKLFIVASNQSYEYDFCHNFINITSYKPV